MEPPQNPEPQNTNDFIIVFFTSSFAAVASIAFCNPFDVARLTFIKESFEDCNKNNNKLQKYDFRKGSIHHSRILI